MCLELLEYVTIDKFVDRHNQRDIHIYYKLIDKPLRDKTNALPDARANIQKNRNILQRAVWLFF